MTTKWKSKQTKCCKVQSSGKLITYEIQIEYLILHAKYIQCANTRYTEYRLLATNCTFRLVIRTDMVSFSWHETRWKRYQNIAYRYIQTFSYSELASTWIYLLYTEFSGRWPLTKLFHFSIHSSQVPIVSLILSSYPFMFLEICSKFWSHFLHHL